jgi:uncharacterized SAM-binding protein YcdF (DUF218 family)
VEADYVNPITAISEFVFVEHQLAPSDVILVPGGSSVELIEKACSLFHQGFAPYILPSGGPNPRIDGFDTEWDWFYSIAIKNDIPASAILKENRARSTFENARFSAAVVHEKSLRIESAILVTKAFHTRRALLTYQTEFSTEIEYRVCPIVDRRRISKDNWFQDQQKIDKVFNEIEKIGKYFAKHVQTWRSTFPEATANR